MPLDALLAWLPAGSPEEALARQVNFDQLPAHLAIIMDGNGRWAEARGLPRSAGHRVGARAVERVVAAARRAGVGILSLYAFSEDNWQRPVGEVRMLMRLLERHLGSEARRCRAEGIRINVIGRRERLTPRLVRAVEAAEATTASGEGMWLRLAVDHSSRAALAQAAELCARGRATSLRHGWELALHSLPSPDLDLVIRTSGEQRLSDFLLLESAYAELLFLERLWPDFGGADLENALATYSRRERRFGGVGSPEAGR